MLEASSKDDCKHRLSRTSTKISNLADQTHKDAGNPNNGEPYSFNNSLIKKKNWHWHQLAEITPASELINKIQNKS